MQDTPIPALEKVELQPVKPLPPVNVTDGTVPFKPLDRPSVPPIDHRPATAGRPRSVRPKSSRSGSLPPKERSDWSQPGSSKLSKKHACILVTVCAQLVILALGVMVYFIIGGRYPDIFTL